MRHPRRFDRRISAAGDRVNAPAPPHEDHPAFEAPPAQPAPYPRRISSHALMGSGREVEILHGTQLYRLRLTSLDKLILTK